MTVISSQKFLDYEIVEKKINELKKSNITGIVVPVVNAYFRDLAGNELYILADKHHTMAAAKQLGLEIVFHEIDDEMSYYKYIEQKNGEAILQAWYMDSNWYYINADDKNLIGVDVW